jgi:cytoskeletal protein CcmA (bactofilin family)
MPRLSRLISLLWLCFFLLSATGQVEATDGLRGFGTCTVAEEEVILDDFYFACRTLVIRGYIEGDVAGIASEVVITREAHITGDIWMAGGHLTIEGAMGDDVHFIGADLDIGSLARFPHPRADIMAIGISLEVGRNTVIPNDVLFYGYQAILRGDINGDLDFQGQSLTIQGTIGGDVAANVGDVEATTRISSLPFVYSVDFRDPGLYFSAPGIRDEGFITGNLVYTAPQRISTIANVGGDVNYTQSVQSANLTEVEQSDTFLQIVANYILMTARDVIALSLVGILLFNFFPKVMMEPAYRVQKRPISALGWGVAMTFFTIPTTALLILVSLITVLVVFVLALSALEITFMVSLLLLVINLGFVGGFFFLWAFVGRTITCFVLGFFALRWLRKAWVRYIGEPPAVMGEFWFAILLGVLIVSLLVHLPLGSLVGYLQLALTGVLVIVGFGALFMYLVDLRKANGGRLVVFTWLGIPATKPDIPMVEETWLEIPPGTANLPPGFTGFED